VHQPKKAMVDRPNGITPASELATSYSSGWWQLFSCSPDRSGIILDQGMPYEVIVRIKQNDVIASCNNIIL